MRSLNPDKWYIPVICYIIYNISNNVVHNLLDCTKAMPFALLLGELVTIWACPFIRSTCAFRIPQRKVTANKGVKKHHLRELLHILWLFCQLLSVNNVCSSAGAVRTDDKGHRALWKNDSLQTLLPYFNLWASSNDN